MVVTLLDVLTFSNPGLVEYSVGVVVAVDIVLASVVEDAVGARPEIVVGASVDSVRPLDRTTVLLVTGIGSEDVP
jgi:hypothetical protein